MAAGESGRVGESEGRSRREVLKDTAALGAALVVPGWLAGCGGGGGGGGQTGSPAQGTQGGGKPRRGGTLMVATHDGGPQDTLSPWNLPTFATMLRAYQVHERLYQNKNGTPVPRLAESAEGNADGTQWRIKLRSGVKFHNGKEMTAHDVMASFAFVADKKNGAESQSRVDPIDFRASRIVSPTEIVFRLKRPIGDFEGLLAEKALWIVPNGKADLKHPVGTGPFTFVSFAPGGQAVYRRNPDYWDAGPDKGPWVDEVQIQTILDAGARLNALLGGQVHEISNLDFVAAKAQLDNHEQIQIIRTHQPNTAPFTMTLDSAQFRDPRVREAMKLAADRQAMVNTVLLGFGSVGNDLFGQGLPSYNDQIPQREYDPEKAASLLKQAGVANLQLTLPTTAGVALNSAAAFRQSAQKAGISITLRRIPSDSYFSNDLYLKTPFYETQWGQSFESQAQDGLLRSSPYNETHWSDPKWEQQFFRAQGIVDRDQRNAAYKALQQPLWERGGYVSWGVYDTLDGVSPKVRGVTPNASSDFQNLGGMDLKDHWLA